MIDPANPAIMSEPFFQTKEPHHFRYTDTDEGPILRLHADDDGRDMYVLIPLDYQEGPDIFLRLPLRLEDRRRVVEWFAQKDGEPF